VVEAIVEAILQAKAATGEGVVFGWWGTHAKTLRKTIEKFAARYPSAKVAHVDHCNPAAMGDAVCDGDHFGAINDAVEALGMKRIDWLPAAGWDTAANAGDAAEAARLGDFIEKTRELHRLYLERLQGVGDEALREIPAIRGIGALALSTLADATAPLVARFPALAFYVDHGRAFAAKARALPPAAGAAATLSDHEIASLFLYTTESILYKQINQTLRDPDRAKAPPWWPFLRLFLSAIAKLPPHSGSLWRGVAKDLRHEYPVGRIVTWWGISSCTADPRVARAFLGARGRRMLFEVVPRTAVSIKAFSAFQGEDEYVLAPGTRLEVAEVRNEPSGLSVVRLVELEGERLVS
jgi:hypothetical protein